MPNSYIPRQITSLFLNWLTKPEVVFLTGARQVGKTTFLRKIADDLQKQNRQVTFVNIEAPHFRRQAQTDPFGFVANLTLGKSPANVGAGRHFVIIDEFQKAPELLEAIKLYYDQDQKKQTKFILSGSASVITRKRGEESLLGRSVRLNLFSYSYLEFLQAKNHKFIVNKTLKNLLLGKTNGYQPGLLPTDTLLQEYLLWGGFPRIVKEEARDKLTLYENIRQAYLEKDIQTLIREEQLIVFDQLMEMLAARSGQLISFSSLASDLTVAPQTVRHLAFLLKHSYWLDFVYPLARYGSGYKKSPKVYFHDLGFRHGLLRWLSLPKEPGQMGAVVENSVFNCLTRLIAYDPAFSGKISFWQTYDGAEVDFVFELGQHLIGIEVKYQSFKKPFLTRGTENFIDKFKPQLLLVVTKQGSFQKTVAKTRVVFVPLIEFMRLV